MTASLVRTPGTGNPLSPQACQHTMAVFDGRMRYDLQFAFKRMDKVKAEKGYDGPVVVCAVYFSPVAGYIPSRAAIRYIAKLRDMEIWLAPIAGTRVLVPYRAQGPTPIGQVVLEATQFVSVAIPTRASANGTEDAVTNSANWRLTLRDGLTRATAVNVLRGRNRGRLKICRGYSILWRREAAARCRRERSRTTPESVIRARFVPDLF